MTGAEWKKVNECLQYVLCSGAKLKIDGYEVYLCLRQISQFKNAIVVYVNGVFKGEWLAKDCEERRRFFPCKKKCPIKNSDFKNWGIRSKKQIQSYKDEYSYNEYSSAWTSFTALKKHFEANNKSIELIGG